MCGRFVSIIKEFIYSLARFNPENYPEVNIINDNYIGLNNNKIPFLISIPVLETIFFAAIWRVENINNNHVPVCCILTKEASDTIKSVHGRMPIIYSANDALTFLKEKETKTENPNLENDLDYYTVSKKINNPQNNSVDCVEYFKYSY